jgi:hypothetical protein
VVCTHVSIIRKVPFWVFFAAEYSARARVAHGTCVTSVAGRRKPLYQSAMDGPRHLYSQAS